jgi:hypothetical protein
LARPTHEQQEHADASQKLSEHSLHYFAKAKVERHTNTHQIKYLTAPCLQTVVSSPVDKSVSSLKSDRVGTIDYHTAKYSCSAPLATGFKLFAKPSDNHAIVCDTFHNHTA